MDFVCAVLEIHDAAVVAGRTDIEYVRTGSTVQNVFTATAIDHIIAIPTFDGLIHGSEESISLNLSSGATAHLVFEDGSSLDVTGTDEIKFLHRLNWWGHLYGQDAGN